MDKISIEKIIVYFFLLLVTNCALAQDGPPEEMNRAIDAFQKDDYVTAYSNLTKVLENKLYDGSEYAVFKAHVIYLDIFAAAGMVSQKKMTHDKFLQVARKFVGQKIATRPFECIDSGRVSFNTFGFRTDEDGSQYGAVTSSNNHATSIFIFEKYLLAEKATPSDYFGKHVVAMGTLGSVEINPNRSMIWISRMTVKDAEIQVVPYE